jgi:iron complex transport system substrate-binding protein
MEHIPQRIVCLQPSASAILASVGQLERVVACTRYCAEILPEVLKRPRIIVADSWTAQAEQIVAVKPDLVIAAVPYQEKAVSQILRAGIRFLGLAPRTLNDIYVDIAAIAGVVGAIDQGETVIAGMQRAIEDVRAKTRAATRPRVFCEEWGKPIIASQPWVAELVEAAGGDFIGQAGQQTSAEAVAEQNPDVLVAAWCGAGDRVPIEKMIRERKWGRTPAAQNRRVFCIPDELLNTPAPTLLRGLEALAAAIHPDRCPAPPCLRQITEVSPTTAPATLD